MLTNDILTLVLGSLSILVGLLAVYATRTRNQNTAREQDQELRLLSPVSQGLNPSLAAGPNSITEPALLEALPPDINVFQQSQPNTNQTHEAIGDALEAFSRLIRSYG